jgi:hypothetical protein
MIILVTSLLALLTWVLDSEALFMLTYPNLERIKMNLKSLLPNITFKLEELMANTLNQMITIMISQTAEDLVDLK